MSLLEKLNKIITFLSRWLNFTKSIQERKCRRAGRLEKAIETDKFSTRFRNRLVFNPQLETIKSSDFRDSRRDLVYI
jgi:hypothetical protein